MKVKASVKPICAKCKVIKRKGKVMIICENPKVYVKYIENYRELYYNGDRRRAGSLTGRTALSGL